MKLSARFRSWFRASLHRSRTEREMENELRFHIEHFTEDLVRKGVPFEEATRRHPWLGWGGQSSPAFRSRASLLADQFPDGRFDHRIATDNGY